MVEALEVPESVVWSAFEVSFSNGISNVGLMRTMACKNQRYLFQEKEEHILKDQSTKSKKQ